MSGTDLVYARTSWAWGMCRRYQVSLRYAVSGTAIACSPTCLSARYAMSGTGMAYGGTTELPTGCYAMSSTERAYAGTTELWY
eukprot:3653366-Rhodomonas_salina.2